MNLSLVKNCRICNPGGGPGKPADLLIRDGRIAASGSTADGAALDAGGRAAVPGFIDVHVQGAGGADVLDAKPEAFKVLAGVQARFGVTSYLATTVFRSDGRNPHLAAVRELMAGPQQGAACLGTHLEGPFIAMGKKGMIHPDCIVPPDKACMDSIFAQAGNSLKMMTIAPEIEGNLDFIRLLADRGVVPSFGHSTAGYDAVVEGIKAGITHVTHLFNAMMSIHHREPGPLPALVEAPGVSAQVISDGVHLHPAIVRMVYREFGLHRIALITDGMQPMGLPDGEYEYNRLTYTAKDGVARYHDGTLIGSALGMSTMVARFIRFTGCTLGQALVSACEVPARVLGLEASKGRLEPGKDADITVLNDDLSVFATIVAGNAVYQA